MKEPLRITFMAEADCSVCELVRRSSSIFDTEHKAIYALKCQGWKFDDKCINGKLVVVHATCPDCAKAADVAKKPKATALQDARDARKAAKTQADDAYKTAVGKL